ncbi:MAG: hypothetical protein LC099_02350 [Anaerolineales bacterium]|nr:hypothetical protein [Anaerolineales bacterium]
MTTIKSEIAKVVVQKVKGINEAQAEMAVSVVLDFVAKKLPPQMGGQLEAILDGSVNLSDGFGLDDAAGLLGGLLGGKK